MTTERAWVVGLPAEDGYLSLLADVAAAAARSRKAEPGDRLDIARFEALATRLEQAAINDARAERLAVAVPEPGSETLLLVTEPSAWPATLPADIRAAAWRCVDRQRIPVVVVDPFVSGETMAGLAEESSPPTERWDSAGQRGRAAVQARFRAQILDALNPRPGRPAAISPSGIQNSVVTEMLREFVTAVPGSTRADAPVEYRDGSRAAHPFPLRSLALRETLPPASLQLRFALLSIRHSEMDSTIDGAWLRNAEISRPRPAALTDDLVYDISLRQLEELCRGERHVRLYLYQTGLETAVVGFYRALVHHLLRQPRSVSVQPMYFENSRDGRRRSKGARSIVTKSSLFRKGTPWTM